RSSGTTGPRTNTSEATSGENTTSAGGRSRAGGRRGTSGRSASSGATVSQAAAKIRHVIVIMQENRSFDSYFGTYPGADGIPRSGGRFTACSPNPLTKQCEYP